jgi:hypothetical protein
MIPKIAPSSYARLLQTPLALGRRLFALWIEKEIVEIKTIIERYSGILGSYMCSVRLLQDVLQRLFLLCGQRRRELDSYADEEIAAF